MASAMPKSIDSVMKLPSQLLTPEDVDKINKMFDAARSKKVASERDLSRVNYSPAVLGPIISKGFFNVYTHYLNFDHVRRDESFMGFRPTVMPKYPNAVAVHYKTITIGSDSQMNVNLSKYGFCNNVSPVHASITVNKRTGFHEITNHSEYGTIINNTLFGRVQIDKENMAHVNKYQLCKPQSSCKCSRNINFRICDRQEPIRIGHGFIISFGCIPFVFSILRKQ